MQPQKRQTSYKFWIKDIAEAEAGVNEDGAMYFKIRGKDVLRVNVLAVVIHKYVSENGNYVFVTLDDGSGQTRLKAWNEDTQILSKAEIGDLVMVLGKVGLNNNEIFIRPEAIRKMDIEWEQVRRLELTKLYGKPEGEKRMAVNEVQDSPSTVVEEMVVGGESALSIRQKVISYLEKGPGTGVEEGELVKSVGGKSEEVVQELLSEGEVFRPRKGYLKLIG